MIISASKTKENMSRCSNINIADEYLKRKTFYGDVNNTIRSQYLHIINVQNYYLSMIDESISISTDIIEMRKNMADKLLKKYSC